MNLRCDLNLDTAIQSVHKTSQFMMTVPSYKVWLEKHQQFSSRYGINSQFDYMSPHCTLDFAQRQKTIFFRMTFWPMVVTNNHTKFGYESFSGSEDIVQTNIDYNFESFFTFTFNTTMQSFCKDSQAHNDNTVPSK